jgi:hypothetical protein
LFSIFGAIVLFGTLLDLYEMYAKQLINNYLQNFKSTGILNPIINDEETVKLVQVKETKSRFF